MPKLTYLGHSAFLIESAEGTVAVDPFLSGNPMAARTAEDIAPHTILLTHAHNDHVGDTVAIAKRTGAQVISTFELGEWLATQGVTNATNGNHGGTIAFTGGTAKLVPAWHTSSYFDGERFVAPGVPAGLIVRIDGKTIYFAGDTCLFGDMRLIGDEGLDVAVVPIGDRFTMGPADAVKAVGFLRPGLVIPCHYNTFPVIEQDGAAFAAAVAANTTARCNPLKPGASVDL
ncbi:MAG: metal-dependent hydrolase [Thermomicrobiales bacterium]|nr:metal-dependent hydrolase [Thermomicrobiales bacterium]